MTNNDVAKIAGQGCDIPNLKIVLQNIIYLQIYNIWNNKNKQYEKELIM